MTTALSLERALILPLKQVPGFTPRVLLDMAPPALECVSTVFPKKPLKVSATLKSLSTGHAKNPGP